jgi:chorismate mutase
MSPKNKIKLDLLRVKLDKLDNQLLLLIKKRTILVNDVVNLKQYKKEIVDKKRIDTILKKIKLKSKKLNIDTQITKRIWKNMIWSYINYERKKFKSK